MPSGVVLAEAPSGRVILSNEQFETIWRRPPLPSGGAIAFEEVPGRHPDGRPYTAEDWPLARSLAGETVISEE
ncbi:MAG: histidine kinase, partial [Actinobacteria bacterium]|nr:histidine kinase [Actinomycetota bacterium]